MRVRRNLVARSLLAGILVSALASSVTSAWTQQTNNFDNFVNGQPGTPNSCTNVSPWWCNAWPKTAQNLSVTEWVYLDSTLVYSGLNVDLKANARAAFPQWDHVAARNPVLTETTNLSLASTSGLIIYADNTLPSGVYGATTVASQSGSPHHIVYALTDMSTIVVWNNRLDFSSYVDPDGDRIYRADSRKVVTHEIGHSEGLGHTLHTAIMHQGATTFYTVQSDDAAGLIAAYGAYP